MLWNKFITQEDHEKAFDALDIELSDGEEPPISENINDIIKSTVNYLIAHDKEELMELLENLQKEVTGEIDRAIIYPRVPFRLDKVCLNTYLASRSHLFFYLTSRHMTRCDKWCHIQGSHTTGCEKMTTSRWAYGVVDGPMV